MMKLVVCIRRVQFCKIIVQLILIIVHGYSPHFFPAFFEKEPHLLGHCQFIGTLDTPQ
jgi:hypothetical protein